MKHVKFFEDFDNKTIPEQIIYICDFVRKDLIKNGNNSFNKKYEFGNYKFQIDITHEISETNSYASEIDILDLLINLKNDDYILYIPIEIKSLTIDFNKTISIVAHELRHLHDVLTLSETSYEIEDFYKKRNFKQFKKNKLYWIFIFQIYLTLEHEMIARNNMIYPFLRWCGETDKNKIIKKYKEMYTYTSLIDISNFNHLNFINKMKEKDLILNTNQFIKDIANENNFCYNRNDLIKFYKKWEDFFKKKSKDYLNHVNYEINKVYDDIINDKVYERNFFLFEHNGFNINVAEKIFDMWYKELFF